MLILLTGTSSKEVKITIIVDLKFKCITNSSVVRRQFLVSLENMPLVLF